MTAKEDKTNFISHYLEDWIPETKMSETIERLNEVIESYCREQRELCNNEILDERHDEKLNSLVNSIKDMVLTAPMPEL